MSEVRQKGQWAGYPCTQDELNTQKGPGSLMLQVRAMQLRYPGIHSFTVVETADEYVYKPGAVQVELKNNPGQLTKYDGQPAGMVTQRMSLNGNALPVTPEPGLNQVTRIVRDNKDQLLHFG